MSTIMYTCRQATLVLLISHACSGGLRFWSGRSAGGNVAQIDEPMIIEQADVYVVKIGKHYRVGGHEATPNRIPGTDYYFEPNWRQAYSRLTETCVVRLTTSTGIYGWGEAQAPLLPETPASIIVHLLGPAMIGQPAIASEPAYERLYYTMLARGHNSSFFLDSIGAIDTALWDIRGHVWKAPISELLGGRFRDKLPAYLSGLRRPTTSDRLNQARDAIREGLQGVKLFVGKSSAASLDEIRAVREAIGRDAMLAADCIHATDWDGALRTGRLLDELNGAFLEAPLGPEDVDGHRDLGARIETRIAGGEQLRSVQQFMPWLQSRALRVVQPDVVRAGVTAARRIADLAHALHLPVALHVGVCTAIGMAATWQVAASLPNFLIQEHQSDLFEAANRLLESPLTTEGGQLVVPTAPGLGICIEEERVLEHTTQHWTITADGAHIKTGETH